MFYRESNRVHRNITMNRYNICDNCGSPIKPYKNERYGYEYKVDDTIKIYCIKCHLEKRYSKKVKSCNKV